LLARWWTIAPAGRLLNGYGPSEATVVTTFAELTASDGGDPVRIGTPIWNAEAWIVDSCGRLVPDGVAGELWIGGAGLARGYRGDPEQTRRRFVPHPLAADRRVYRSGDLVRRRGGAIEFLGRLDDQVKIRGFRVDPEEIAVHLRRHPNVIDAAVVARHDSGTLAAYLAPAVRGTLTAGALRAHLRLSLPEYLVPTSYFETPSLPRGANGKLLRDELAQWATVIPDAADGEVASTPTERRLAAIWESLLESGRVGIDRSFFDLGGHSLLAAQLVARVREAFGVDMALAVVFDAPTVRRMAAWIDAHASGREARVS
jgi:acyl-CoA synthetase (AMP-forming)/AMP-acid ligase II/acyl carrier protein